MTLLSERYLKTGGDPRTLPDYAALRDELGKLTHPARPDVNWHLVEKLSLTLFEQNGVELQTAAWYTLARTQLGGLAGLNEGVSILEALISHQWGSLWPRQAHARVEILSGLSRRLQQMMRTLPLSYSDLSQLYHAEQQLGRLNASLQRLELKHLSQFDALATLMHTSAVRLENSDTPAVTPSAAVLPAAVPPVTGGGRVGGAQWVYVAQSQPAPEGGTAVPAKASRWKPFVAGVVVTLVVGSAARWAWLTLHRPDALLTQLYASLSPPASPLSEEQLNRLQMKTMPPDNLMPRTQQQLTRLSGLAPDWALDYGQRLVHQAKALSPPNATTEKMAAAWQQQVGAGALPPEVMSGWQQGMAQLQQLTARLNALDGQRGKYITVSELKSVMYDATQAFNRSLPAEERLRLYAARPSETERRQAEMALDQLQKRYFLLKQAAESPGATEGMP
ncbi:VasL domain-containing protein [Erwinia persicina]|uniref:VasL domain-containing protein n=1 Tax=Erwinia persicina TaxID=55211 RepID=UPI0017876C63|nr:VasL domain-containing protein [Erwinia persicina]MBD8215855.1 type VI secretion system ImpA family N-terminal domain-containing protein [Erwinia persicina]